MFYREDEHGQILEEGITEAGSISSFIAAGTSYSAHAEQMIPFYIYYSMFGYQRVGDLVWAAADSRARGFLLGGTAGRTTLNGEGLQHEDGHSHVLFSVVPNCRAYDPAFAYEVAVIIQDGLRAMVAEQEDVFYYLTLMNENYVHPPMPEGAQEGILRGMYLLRDAGSVRSRKPRVQLLGSGTILREVLAAAELLEQDWGVLADVWSVTSFTELRRDGIEVDRWNTLNPLAKKPREAFVTSQLAGRSGPVIASTDYIRAYADQIRAWVAPGMGGEARSYRVLGTDGFGRSDSREALRRFFEVDRHHVAVAALKSLADEGKVKLEVVARGDQALRARPRGADADHRMSAAEPLAVEVPDIGDFDEVPVIEILVSVGDAVAVEDPLVTLESDKATMDVPSPVAGTVKAVTSSSATASPRAVRCSTSRRPISRSPPPAVAPAAAPMAAPPSRSVAARAVAGPGVGLGARTSGRRRERTARDRYTPARRSAGWRASSGSTCAVCPGAGARAGSSPTTFVAPHDRRRRWPRPTAPPASPVSIWPRGRSSTSSGSERSNGSRGRGSSGSPLRTWLATG